MAESSSGQAAWTEADIPDQSDTTVLVTGANSGLGLRTATVLASKGAHVFLGCRSPERGQEALEHVKRAATQREPQLVNIDVADLGSVHECARTVRDITGETLHLLINNAGVMATPKDRTADGFELQLGTNHLGHAVLTWQLMPALRGGAARVVTVSSMAAAQGKIDVHDPGFERRTYNPAAAYGQAKLANQVFALELDRRLRAAGEPVTSVAAHPGLTATGLAGTMATSYRNGAISTVLKLGSWVSDNIIAQNVERGALPQLYAATAPEVTGGQYIGPDGFRQLRGSPTSVKPLRPARDPEIGSKLWELTASLTGTAPDPT